MCSSGKLEREAAAAKSFPKVVWKHVEAWKQHTVVHREPLTCRGRWRRGVGAKPATVQQNPSPILGPGWGHGTAEGGDTCTTSPTPLPMQPAAGSREAITLSWRTPISWFLIGTELIGRLNLSELCLPLFLLLFSWQIWSWFPFWFLHHFKLHVLQLLCGLANLIIVRNAETFRNDWRRRIRTLRRNYIAQNAMTS